MLDFKDRVAIITGATGGIGEAVAAKLHAQGASVVITGRKQDALDALKAGLGGKCAAIQADLSSDEGIKKVVDCALGNFGKIDILVNNAGLTADALIIRMKDEDWNRVLEVNLTAPFKLAREALAPMMKNRYGRIVNITSIVGWTGNAGQANYTASKGALTSLTKTLAAEVASRNITANCVAPGFITTAMTDALPDEIKAHMLEQIPLKRFGAAEDVANAVAFLASEEAAYITGQTLHVNGGMLRV